MDRRSSFSACLARLEQWLASEQIPYAVFGSVAAAAWTDQGMSLDFDRRGSVTSSKYRVHPAARGG